MLFVLGWLQRDCCSSSVGSEGMLFREASSEERNVVRPGLASTGLLFFLRLVPSFFLIFFLLSWVSFEELDVVRPGLASMGLLLFLGWL